MIKLLICDDNPADIFLAEEALDEADFQCIIETAKDGEDALAKAILFKPNIILLDLNMPKMNGLEFLEEFRKRPEHADIIVVILTTSSQENEIFDTVKKGADSYMVKNPDGSFTPQMKTLKSIYKDKHFKFIKYKRNQL